MKVSQTKTGWSLDVTIGGKRIRESFDTKRELEDFVTELRDQARRRRYRLAVELPAIELRNLVAERERDLNAKNANHKQGQRVLKAFLGTLPDGILLDEVKTAHIRDFVKRRQREGLKTTSVNRELSHISGMLKAAAEIFAGLEEWRPPRIPWQPVPKRGRERIITADERRDLLETLRFPGLRVDGVRNRPENIESRRDVADILELGLHSGMRGGEIRKIEWRQVDFEAGEVHLPKTKNGEPRDVPLNRRTLEILRRRYELRKTRWVFPNRAGTGPRAEISRVVRSVAKGLGLEYGREIEDGFTPHSTRHTATTEMLRAGVDMKTVQDVVGHSDQVMTLRYAHSTRASRKEAVERLLKGSSSTKS